MTQISTISIVISDHKIYFYLSKYHLCQPKTIMIRNAIEADFDAAYGFIERLWTYNDYNKDTLRPVYMDIINNENDFMFFLIEGNEYIGFCHGTFFNTFWLSGQTCYLSSIITVDKYRRKGYAHKLVDHVKELAVERGCAAIVLDSGLPRKDAHNFYEKYGFEKVAYCYELKL